MIVADEVETADGIPIYYGGDHEDYNYEDPGMKWRQWMGFLYRPCILRW